MDSEAPASPSNTIRWLEDELRQTKAQFAKLQQQVEQLQGQLWHATEEAQRTQEALTTLRISLGSLPGLQEQARQLANEATLLKEQQGDLRSALEAALHQGQATSEKERQEWGQVLRRVEGIDKMVGAAEQRFASLEEGQRLLRNDGAIFQAGLAQLERDLDELKARVARSLEADKRLEQGLERFDGDLMALHKQDEVIMERLQLQAEQARRLEDRLSVLQADQTTHDDLLNKMELVRVEGRQLSERQGVLEKGMEGQYGSANEQARALDLLGAKLQGQTERLLELQRQVGAYHQDLLTHLHRWSQLQEKQRRRQLSHLEQEVRELKQYDLKLNAE